MVFSDPLACALSQLDYNCEPRTGWIARYVNIAEGGDRHQVAKSEGVETGKPTGDCACGEPGRTIDPG